MIVLLLLSLFLCIPGALGLLLLKSDNERLRKKAGLALFGVAALLLVGWVGWFATVFVGFGIGGGSPTILQVAVPALIVSSPLAVAAIFTGFAGYLLANRESEDDQ